MNKFHTSQLEPLEKIHALLMVKICLEIVKNIRNLDMVDDNFIEPLTKIVDGINQILEAVEIDN